MLDHKPRCVSNSLRLRRCGPPPSLRPLPQPDSAGLALPSSRRALRRGSFSRNRSRRDHGGSGTPGMRRALQCSPPHAYATTVDRRTLLVRCFARVIVAHHRSSCAAMLRAFPLGRRFTKGVHDQRLRSGLHHGRIAGATHDHPAHRSHRRACIVPDDWLCSHGQYQSSRVHASVDARCACNVRTETTLRLALHQRTVPIASCIAGVVAPTVSMIATSWQHDASGAALQKSG